MARRVMVLVMLGVLVSGCAAWRDLTTESPLRSVHVVARSDANENSATALSLVFVYERDAGRLLPDSAPAWFSQRGALVSALASSIDVVALQLPPGASDVSVSLPDRHGRAVAVYAYARYHSPAGRQRLDLGGRAHLLITLCRDHAVMQSAGDQPTGATGDRRVDACG